jgi:hypothetical protein
VSSATRNFLNGLNKIITDGIPESSSRSYPPDIGHHLSSEQAKHTRDGAPQVVLVHIPDMSTLN